MAYREISVDELRFGMYVARLDRPWTDTPFMFQGFVLRSEKQLEALKKYCKKVYVDPEKVDRKADEEANARAAAAVRGTTVYANMTTVEVELPRAEKAYQRSTVVVTEISAHGADEGCHRQRAHAASFDPDHRKRGAQPGRDDPARQVAGKGWWLAWSRG